MNEVVHFERFNLVSFRRKSLHFGLDLVFSNTNVAEEYHEDIVLLLDVGEPLVLLLEEPATSFVSCMKDDIDGTRNFLMALQAEVSVLPASVFKYTPSQLTCSSHA